MSKPPKMMETQSGGAGPFADFDLSRVQSPCFVIDEAKVEQNLSVLADIADRSGAKVLSALKAFSFPALAPLVSKYLSGTCTSGLFEAKLAKQFYSGEITTFCAGYKETDLPEIIEISDHLIFNSSQQLKRFMPLIQGLCSDVEIGLRINPEHSEGLVEKYDPCAAFSRLGTPISSLSADMLEGVVGLHFHTLCEQEFEPLERTWAAIEPQIQTFLPQLEWLNFGGGHHITRADYNRDGLVQLIQEIRSKTGLDIYLEPGEAVALDAGILVGEVLDVVENGMPIVITDISATCHMPDVIEAPYRPDMLGEAKSGPLHRLGGPSCLAGDVIGDYKFEGSPDVGDRIAFLDQAHYSFVKTNTFNGVPLPAIALWNSETDDLKMICEFGYEDFRMRLHQ
ncbi:carboxynorspermidine decarboxylase [Lentilitoribacter sp. EG35]|uniref:carboxynorspermidine decarboxylase n=1 Tax=Lentilitoribacter sp. EG35 TaxID=3234192 RepID=UPI003460DEBC